MSSRKFIAFAIALFIVGALPFLIVQPTAAASAGLSLGFSAPLSQPLVMVLLLCAGFGCALLPRDGLAMVPLAYLLMLSVGGMLVIDLHMFPGMRFFILGAILCLSLLVGMAAQKINVLAILSMGSIGFHLGGVFMSAMPNIASPMYYLLGVLLSLLMILGISVAFSVTLLGDHEIAWEKLKASPRLGFLRALFF